MKNRLWLLLALSFLPQSFAQAADDVSETLRRQTQEMVDAVSDGKAAVWDRYLDPQAVYTAEDGSVSTKAQMVEQFGPLPAGVSGVLKVTDFKATVHESVAITNYVIDENEVYHGHKLHCQYRNTDTWVKTPGGWRLLAAQALALRTDPPAVALTAKQMAEYVGTYELAPAISYEIRLKDGGLEGQQTGRPAEALKAEAPDVLFVPGKPRYRKIFQRGADGHVTGYAERREAWDIDWTRKK